jgi:LmbE family N-acetylglucosaminyl deacetylase
MMFAKKKLNSLDESWQKALAVVAHPDDLEYGAASAVARWTSQGKQVNWCCQRRGTLDIPGQASQLSSGNPGGGGHRQHDP